MSAGRRLHSVARYRSVNSHVGVTVAEQKADEHVLAAIMDGRTHLDISGLRCRAVPAALIAACVLALAESDEQSVASATAVLRQLAAQEQDPLAVLREKVLYALRTLKAYMAEGDPIFMQPESPVVRILEDILEEIADELSAAGRPISKRASARLTAAAEGVFDAAAEQDWAAFSTSVATWSSAMMSALPGSRAKNFRPPATRFCRNLRYLNLSDNALDQLPSELSALTRLTNLDLADNAFDQLPQVIDQLALTELNISGNKLKNIQIDAKRHPQMRRLFVARNEIETIPGSIFSLPIDKLDASGNAATSMDTPSSSTLQSLDISHNAIHHLPSVTELKALREINLSENFIECLPERLPDSLRWLNASDNNLRALPDVEGYYKNLAFLDVSDNELHTLPYAFGEMPDTADVLVDDNNLTRTMIAAADVGSLLTYIRSLGEPTEPCREAKLALIGEGNVGKSSLVAALAGEPFIRGRPTTHGIELRQLVIQHSPSGNALHLNTWDFGGQEIYRVTQQFYLSQEALFVVVWRPREGFEQAGIRFWLERLRRLVGNKGIVFLVSTYADEGRQTHIDFEDLEYRYYPLIRGRFEVDNQTGRGIPALERAIADAAMSLDHIEDPVARSWLDLRNALPTVGRPFMTRSEFDKMASEYGLDVHAGEGWLRLMHALGYFIYYERDIDLRTIVVLDPELLARAVSYVLEDTTVIAAGGVVAHSHLVEVWRAALPEASDASLLPYLLRLMEANDISLRLPDGATSLIVPLLGFRRPLDLPWEPDDPLPPEERQLQARVRFDGEPVGLIPWLIVRTSRWMLTRRWRAGLFAKTHAGEASALLEMIGDHELRLTVRGAYPNELFTVLRSEVRFLCSNRWPFIGLDEVIPCPRCARSADASGIVGEFRISAIMRGLGSGVQALQCGECFESVPVADMLIGYDTSSEEQAGDLFIALLARLDELGKSLDGHRTEFQAHRSVVEAGEGLGDERVLLATVAEQVRELGNVVGLVASDCPRLASITAVGSAKVDPRRVWQSAFELQLWCEEPAAMHPAGLPYRFKRPREWFVRALPVMRASLVILRCLPVLGAGIATTLNPQEVSSLSSRLDAMDSLCEAVWDVSSSSVRGPGRGLSSGGYELRVLKELLTDLDPSQEFRELSPVVAPGGAVLWVCRFHRRAHQPGLPDLF